MPPLPDVASVIRIEFDFTYGEDTAGRCRVFYKYSGVAPSNSDLDEFCDDVFAAITGSFDAVSNTEVHWTAVRAIDLTSATAAVGESTGSIAGTRSGGALSANAAALMFMHVNRRYRGGHPRVYWPFGSQTDLHDAQTWEAASVVAFETAYGDMDTAIKGNGWSGAGTIAQVNVSYYSGFTVVTGVTGRARNVSTPRAAAVVDDVAFFQFRTGVATQRRRLLHLA